MSDSPLKIARILWMSAAITAAIALVFYTGLLDVGIEGWKLAAVFGLIALADLAMSAVILSRRRR